MKDREEGKEERTPAGKERGIKKERRDSKIKGGDKERKSAELTLSRCSGPDKEPFHSLVRTHCSSNLLLKHTALEEKRKEGHNSSRSSSPSFTVAKYIASGGLSAQLLEPQRCQ